MNSLFFYDYPIGALGILEEDNAVSRVFFAFDSGARKAPPDCTLAETKLIKKAAAQLDEYFAGQRKTFDLPLSPRGTDFQTAAWEALQSIPYGQTRCYRDMAVLIGKPLACRAVGMANNRNPIVIIIPCHRVIGANGGLTGYGGGLDVKQYLLGLEKRNP